MGDHYSAVVPANQQAVVDRVAALCDTTPAEVHDVVVAVFSAIAENLADGTTVLIRGFGRFEPRQRRAVTRRNPKTGEDMKIDERFTVAFLPSTSLKGRLNG